MRLTDEDHFTLVDEVLKHAGDGITTPLIADAMVTAVEAIVARHVTAALNEAADVIEAWRDLSERYADNTANDDTDRSKALQRMNAYAHAARIVRNLTPP